MSESFEDYNIAEEMKEKLSAEKIEELGMQVFKRDKSNILKYFHHDNNNGRTQFANHVKDSNEDQNILEGIIETGKWKKLIDYDIIQGSEIKKPEVDKFGNMSRLRINAEFGEDFLREDVNVVFFDRYMEKMAGVLLSIIKETCVEKIKKHAKAPTVDLEGGEWIESNDSIDNDLYNIISTFEKQKTGGFSLTNFFTSRRAFNAVKKYYRSVDDSFDPNDILPNEEVKKAMESIPQLEEGLIGIDVTKNPCRLFYNVDPRYTSNKTELKSFLNVIVDDTNMKGIHPHTLAVEMFVEFGLYFSDTHALLYQPDV